MRMRSFNHCTLASCRDRSLFGALYLLLVPGLVAASVCSERTSSCPNLARGQTALSPSQLVHAAVSVCNSEFVGIREVGMLDRWKARLFC